MDGVPSTFERAIHAVNSQAEAKRVAALLRERGELPPGTEIDWKVAREISLEENARIDFQLQQQRGGVFFGRRGEKLTDMEGLSRIQDPLAAMSAAIEKVAHNMSHDDYLTSMRTRFVNTFDDLIRPSADGRKHFPENIDELLAPKGFTKRHSDAAKLHDYILHMGNIQSNTSVEWNKFFLRLADWLETGSGAQDARRLGALGLRAIGRKDAFQRLRGVTFNMLLALSPIRQLVLQSQQAAYLSAIDPAYVLPAIGKTGLASDMAALNAGQISFTRPALWQKVRGPMSKIAGFSSPEEYEAFIKGFRNSGLPASIDSHSFARDALVDLSESLSHNRWVRYANRGFNAVLLPIKVGKQIGFDVGERLNLQMTWLIARSQFIKNNPGKKWDSVNNLKEISAQARSMALSMTKAGQFKYQKGWASLMTQFASIQHKALLGMTTGKQFTPQQKAGIAATQFMLYGAAGIPLAREALDFTAEQLGLEIPDEWMQYLQAGFMEFSLNGVMRAAFDDDTNISVSESMAPAGGVAKYVDGVVDGAINTPFIDFYFGASRTVMNRFDRAWSIAQYMYQRPDMSTNEQIVEHLSNIARLGSGYSNYLKAQTMRNMGYVVTAGGDPILEATYAESIAKLFGFNPREQDAYYRVLESVSQFSDEQKMDSARTDAEEYFRRMKEVVTYFDQDRPEGLDPLFDKRLEEAARTEAMILNYVDDDYKDAVVLHFRKLANQDLATGKDSLIKRIGRLAQSNELGDELQFVLRRMQNAGLITSETDTKNVEAIWDYMTNRSTEDAQNR